MEYNLQQSIEILSRTPDVLQALLQNLNEDWTQNNEGGESWSPFDVLGHLIHGENTDWMARVEIILSDGDKNFVPFDRFAQFEESKGKNLMQLLDEFREARNRNLAKLLAENITPADFSKTGIHPKFGEVTLEQLLSTWTAHDLGHIGQIVRVMAKQYKEAVGPWREFLPIMDR